jgi:L-alanine-DL-glutamate epimerase-like enolase superfamily enzyme
MPLYRLLGGAVRTTFTMYESIGGGGDMTPDQMLAEVRTEPLVFQDGRITLPGRPGLGLEIDERAPAKALIS